MNNIAVIVPFFKREEITRLCFENLKKQSKKFELDVYTCGSEGETSETLANEYGFNYLEFANEPLSCKLNALIKGTKKGDYDGVLILGSDNFLNNTLFNFYTKLDIEQGKVYGFDDIYFYDVNKQKLFTNGEYFHNKITIGVGRLYTRGFLESVDYNVWKGKKNNGLDGLASKQIGNNEIKISAKDNKVKILDVKHEFNITNPKITGSCKEVSTDELKAFGVIHKKILELKPSENIRTIPRIKSTAFLVEFLEDSIYFKKGEQKGLQPNIARNLIKRNVAKKIK